MTSLFHTPLGQVTYEQVKTFCQEFPEGVRVEYKQEPGNNIPKVISSFANTAGGIWVIGVETDKATNRPKFPLVGMKRRPGLEEQIVQSAQTGIYPALTPDVRVLDVPEKADQMLAVVKVLESTEAPHAIENSTKVYIRNASTTEPYDLADIGRIEYLLKRRQEPEQKREVLIQRMTQRSWCKGRRRRVVVTPAYPRGILLPYDNLFERAERLRQTHSSAYLEEARLIHEGIASVGVSGQRDFYFEANTHGIVLVENQVQPEGKAGDEFTNEETPFVYLRQLLLAPARVVNTALGLLQGEVTDVLIRYELIDWQGMGYLPNDYGRMMTPGRISRDHKVSDAVISVSVPAILETLPDQRLPVLTELMRQVLWAFNVREPNLGERVQKILKEEALI